MKFLHEKKLMLAGIGGAFLMICLVIGAMFVGPMIASAASLQSTPTNTNTKGNTYCNQYQQNLAERLNVSTTTLSQDRKSAADDTINQMVKDGKLKQARATAIEQRINKSSGNGCNILRFSQNARTRLLAQYRQQILNQVAQGLHLSSSQLMTQLKAGKSLQDIATAQKISTSSLQTIITNALNNTIKQAVSDSKLAQKRANTLTTFIQKHPKFIQNLMTRHFNNVAATK